MKNILATVFLSACTAIADPVPVRFLADVSGAATHTAAAYRGETLAIEAKLTDKGRPLTVPANASATMYWQTLTMNDNWWTAPASVTTNGTISATWAPTNDVGAAAYRIFLGISGNGLNYRANLTLRMINSPGFNPSGIQIPPKTIDFARVTVSNAPWATESWVADYVATNAPAGGGGVGGIDEGVVYEIVDHTLADLDFIREDNGTVSVGNLSAEHNIHAEGDIISESNIQDGEGNVLSEKADALWVTVNFMGKGEALTKVTVHDAPANCDWYLEAANGVFTWYVSPTNIPPEVVSQ